MNKALLIGASVISVFTMPPAVTVVLAILSSLYFPPTALALGLLTDALYLPQGAFPTATALGAAGTLTFIFVRRFMKTRIIGT